MRYRLRTLLIVLAVGPALLWIGWTKYEAWRTEYEWHHEFDGMIVIEPVLPDEN